jgi:hypothetical protein
MPLQTLNASGTSIGDLSPLRGMPLQKLYVADPKGAEVMDLSPLSGMPLKSLHCRSADYSPLAGIEFDYLYITDYRGRSLVTLKGVRAQQLRITVTETTNIAPLKDVTFRILELSTPQKLKDLSPLMECLQMEELKANGCPGSIEPLRGHPTLKRIAYSRPGELNAPLMPVEQFWKEYDAKHAAAAPK